ncbi:hypothetical protein [Sulfuracidifex metallicus]|nr:hypothetical protein [Sulfuracidifex metallicus]
MESKQVEKEVVFVSKVSVTKSKKNGKEYVTYKITILWKRLGSWG